MQQRLTGNTGQLSIQGCVQSRYGLQQACGVRVAWPCEQIFNASLFHDATGIHHRHSIGESGYSAEVMRNENEGQIGGTTQLAEQFEQLRLDRDIERRRRFVGDQELRFARERHRDHCALAHAA